MSCLTAALALAVMILMPVVFGMDDDTATNDESTSELLCAAAAAASLVVRRRMLKTVLKTLGQTLGHPLGQTLGVPTGLASEACRYDSAGSQADYHQIKCHALAFAMGPWRHHNHQSTHSIMCAVAIWNPIPDPGLQD